MTQDLKFSGPPRYLTTDWNAARESIKKLESLKPTIVVSGSELSDGLDRLVKEFDGIVIPDYGRFVNCKQ